MNSDEEKELKLRVEEAQALLDLKNQDGWKILEKRFGEFVSSLDTIREINFRNFGIKEAMARQLAINILELWWSEISSGEQKMEQIRKEIGNQQPNNPLYKFHDN